jgi:hypothetical protein
MLLCLPSVQYPLKSLIRAIAITTTTAVTVLLTVGKRLTKSARALTAAPSGVEFRPNPEAAERSALAMDMGTTAQQAEQTEDSGAVTDVAQTPNLEADGAEEAQDANPPGLIKDGAIK